MPDASPLLFSSITIRGVTARNRVVISPMCQYSADNGTASEWHRVHLPNFARGGAGIVFTEATAVEEIGRITHGDLGIWTEQHAEALKPIVAEIKRYGALAGLQLAHAGRKASTQRPWKERSAHELMPSAAMLHGRSSGQQPNHCSRASRSPRADRSGDQGTVRRLRQRRAAGADGGLDVLEVHAAHGYLIQPSCPR